MPSLHPYMSWVFRSFDVLLRISHCVSLLLFTSSWPLMVWGCFISFQVCVCVWGRNKDSSVSIPFCPVCWDPSVTVCVGGWVFWWFVKCLHASDLVQKPKLLSTSSVSPLNYWADYSQIGGEVLNHSRSRVRREQSDVVVYLRLCCICVCCDVNTRTQTHIRPLYPGFFPVSV